LRQDIGRVPGFRLMRAAHGQVCWAMANRYGITINRAWTEWAAEHGVSETIAAALYLVSTVRSSPGI
jgi:hypothetical protein